MTAVSYAYHSRIRYLDGNSFICADNLKRNIGNRKLQK